MRSSPLSTRITPVPSKRTRWSSSSNNSSEDNEEIDEERKLPEEQAIQGVIDQIWETYDVDKSGALDKEETKKFVQDTLGNLGSGDEFSDEAFDEVFSTFDKDNSGTVEKNEMVVFIKQLLGGN